MLATQLILGIKLMDLYTTLINHALKIGLINNRLVSNVIHGVYITIR